MPGTNIRIVFLGVLIAVVPVLHAHHSVSGQFDMSEVVEWTGVISKIDWINPHVNIYLDTTDKDGNEITIRFATAPTAMLRKAGITGEMIMADGATVKVSGLRARDGTSTLGWIIKITYPDGHFYQLGQTPK